MIKQLVARLAAAQKKLDALETRERPLALRGWRDDFLGDSIQEQYTAVSNGVGSGGALQNNAHGGVYKLTAGAGAGRYHYLWLGNAADGYATLDADYGWKMIARMAISHTTTFDGQFGVADSAYNNFVLAGIGTTFLAANWVLITRIGGGAVNVVDTDIAADTDPHVHRLGVCPTLAGHQADYLLDGTRIATTTVSVPIAVLTPIVRASATAAFARWDDLDYWVVIPQNLT